MVVITNVVIKKSLYLFACLVHFVDAPTGGVLLAVDLAEAAVVVALNVQRFSPVKS